MVFLAYSQLRKARLTRHLAPIGFALTLMTFLAPLSLHAQRPGSGRPSGGTIDVQVRYATGEPAPQGIHVRLEKAEGGAEGDCETRDGGKCQFNLSSSGVYIVRVSERGYKEVTSRVELISTTHGYASLELSPLPDEASPQPPKDASPDAVSAAELSVPENARREYERAEDSLKRNKLDVGIEHLRKAIHFYDSFPDAYEMLGSVYVQEQKWPDAQASLERAIQLDPKLGSAYLQLGAVFNQTKDYPKAEVALIHGLALVPDAPLGHYELAKTYWAMGRWQDAAPHAAAAVAAMPDLAPAHVVLGNVLLRQHDLQGALREYRLYLKLDPDGPMAAGTRETIERINKATHAQ